MQALYLSPDSGYHIIWPTGYGEMNIKTEQGYSVTNLMESMSSLWSAAIEKHLDVKKEELGVSRQAGLFSKVP